MNELVKIIWDYLKQKIGVNGTLVIAICGICIFIATSYSKYVVTPDSLQKTKDSLNTRMDKFSAKNGINIAEMELASLRKEKFDLEDLIDCPKPKRKYIERLKEVNERIKELESDKKDFLKVLELK
jgi:hypothetical protein